MHTARNAKVTFTRNVYEKNCNETEERFSEALLEPIRDHLRKSTMKLFKENS